MGSYILQAFLQFYASQGSEIKKNMLILSFKIFRKIGHRGVAILNSETDLRWPDHVCFVGVKLWRGEFRRILWGKIVKILLIASCITTKQTWSRWPSCSKVMSCNSLMPFSKYKISLNLKFIIVLLKYKMISYMLPSF